MDLTLGYTNNNLHKKYPHYIDMYSQINNISLCVIIKHPHEGATVIQYM